MIDSTETPSVLRLRVPAKAEYLVLGRLVLSGLARARPIDPDALSDLKLALTEACSNSMRHAYGPDGGTVDISFELGRGFLAIEVVDDGPAFEPAARVVHDPDQLDEGGLGLAIIEAVSDAVERGPAAGRSGNRIRFVKRLVED